MQSESCRPRSTARCPDRSGRSHRGRASGASCTGDGTTCPGLHRVRSLTCSATNPRSCNRRFSSTCDRLAMLQRVVSILLPMIVIAGRVVDQDDPGAETIPARACAQQQAEIDHGHDLCRDNRGVPPETPGHAGSDGARPWAQARPPAPRQRRSDSAPAVKVKSSMSVVLPGRVQAGGARSRWQSGEDRLARAESESRDLAPSGRRRPRGGARWPC